jgi:hypothetical protein
MASSKMQDSKLKGFQMRTPFRMIRCTIERGGFPSERCFTITDVAGREIVGVANVSHLRRADNAPLADGEPPRGEVIDGFVKCRILRAAEPGTVVIDLPSDDVATVPESELVDGNVAMTC